MSAKNNHVRIHWHCPTCQNAGDFLIPTYATVEDLLKIKDDYHALGRGFYCSGVAILGEKQKTHLWNEDKVVKVDFKSPPDGVYLTDTRSWVCCYCGCEESWFDRQLDENGDMNDRCIKCGKICD